MLGGTIYLNGAQSGVTGGNDTINFSGGTGNAVALGSTTGNWDGVNGSGGTIYLNGAQAGMTGGGDTVNFASGTGNAVALGNTGGHWDGVNGSEGTIYLNSAQAGVTGSTDIMNFAGNNALAVNGDHDTFVFSKSLGESTIIGFNSTDALQLSASDFANWQALQPHIVQYGTNTTITLDSSDVITLANITASTLSATEFRFA